MAVGTCPNCHRLNGAAHASYCLTQVGGSPTPATVGGRMNNIQIRVALTFDEFLNLQRLLSEPRERTDGVYDYQFDVTQVSLVTPEAQVATATMWHYDEGGAGAERLASNTGTD